MNRHLKSLAAGLLLAGSSTLAFADCSSYIGYPDYAASHPECYPGGSAAASVSINATTFSQVGAISAAVGQRAGRASPQLVAADLGLGLAAGGTPQTWNVWGNLSQTDNRISYMNGATLVGNDTEVLNTVLGADYALSPKMVVGVSVAFDRGNMSSLAGNKSTTTGYVIAPYLGYQLDQNFAVDASAGFGAGDYSSGPVRAEADRWFAAANLSYERWMDKLQLTGKLGYLHGAESYGNARNAAGTIANSSSESQLGQVRLGVQAGYWMNGFMPFAGLSYVADVHRNSTVKPSPDHVGRSAFIWSVGANFFSLSSKVTGGISYEQESNRESSRNDVLMANLNFRF